MRKRHRGERIIAVVAALMAMATVADAEVVEFTDKAEWISAVGPFATIDFTEFPDNTVITNQYDEIGVIFNDGNDNIACCSDITFPEDGSGLDGNEAIHLSFLSPQATLRRTNSWGVCPSWVGRLVAKAEKATDAGRGGVRDLS